MRYLLLFPLLGLLACDTDPADKVRYQSGPYADTTALVAPGPLRLEVGTYIAEGFEFASTLETPPRLVERSGLGDTLRIVAQGRQSLYVTRPVRANDGFAPTVELGDTLRVVYSDGLHRTNGRPAARRDVSPPTELRIASLVVEVEEGRSVDLSTAHYGRPRSAYFPE